MSSGRSARRHSRRPPAAGGRVSIGGAASAGSQLVKSRWRRRRRRLGECRVCLVCAFVRHTDELTKFARRAQQYLASSIANQQSANRAPASASRRKPLRGSSALVASREALRATKKKKTTKTETKSKTERRRKKPTRKLAGGGGGESSLAVHSARQAAHRALGGAKRDGSDRIEPGALSEAAAAASLCVRDR